MVCEAKQMVCSSTVFFNKNHVFVMPQNLEFCILINNVSCFATLNILLPDDNIKRTY